MANQGTTAGFIEAIVSEFGRERVTMRAMDEKYLRGRIETLKRLSEEATPKNDRKWQEVKTFCSGGISECQLMLVAMQMSGDVKNPARLL